jgi:hypothetical protein
LGEFKVEVLCGSVESFEQNAASLIFVFDKHAVAADEEVAEDALGEEEFCGIGKCGVVGGSYFGEDENGGLVLYLHQYLIII